MINPKIIKMKGFWKSVFQTSGAFIVVMLLFRIGLVYQLDFSTFVKTEISGRLFMFLISNVLIWILMAFLLTYFNFKKRYKENNKE